MKIYDYLFYRLYKILGIGGDKDVAEWSAVILISVLEFFNVAVLLVFLEKNYDSNIFFKSKISTAFFMLLLMGINYFIFLYKIRYKQIIKYFSNESIIAKYSSLVLVWIYLICSIWLMFKTINSIPLVPTNAPLMK